VSGREENPTDFRGLRLDERQDFRSGAAFTATGEIGDGRTPNLFGSATGMASERESFCLGLGPTTGLATMLACGTIVTSLSFVKPGRCAGVGNFMPEAGGKKGDVQLGLGRTTVLPVEGLEWKVMSSSSDDVAEETSSPDQNFASSSESDRSL